MDSTFPLYVVDGDTVPPGGEATYPRAEVNAADGRPLFHYTGDQPGGPATADGHGGFHAYTDETVGVGETVSAPDPAAGQPGVDANAPDATTTGAADLSTSDLPTSDPAVGTTGNPPESPDRSIDEGGNSGAPEAEAAGSSLAGDPADGIKTGDPAEGDTTTPELDPDAPTAPEGTVTDVSEGASTGQPSRELRETTPDEVAADHPGLGVDQGAPLGEVPDNPSSAVVNTPNTVDQSIDSAHGWDAGVTTLDTGWITAPALSEAWNSALRDGHGVQDDFIKVPAHLREIEDSILALATTVITTIGNQSADQYRVEVEIGEDGGDVRVESRIRRRVGEPAGGDVTPATVDQGSLAAHTANANS